MTIINPHNMQRLYLVWTGLLLSAAGLGVAQYFYLQSFVPLLKAEHFFTAAVVSVSITSVALIMGILFKYFFHRELIAWIFVELIASAGVVMTVLTGWQWYWLVFSAIAFMFLLILGPYLHFD